MNFASTSVTSENLSLVAFKAFGDLVIAINCIERRMPAAGNHIEILLGQHLRPLFDALEPQVTARIIDHPEHSLPSLFTVKKDGMISAMRSALGLKRAVASAGLPSNRILLFDHLGPRERIVTSGWRQIAIPKKDNIYMSYDDFFDRQWPAPVTPGENRPHVGPLRIFPGSRVPAKNLPALLIRRIIDIANARGVRTELMLLDGERPDLEASGLPFTLVPRTFTAMVAAVRGAGKVVSADSMPAHIAEHTGRDMFVLSPVNNRFWLPRTAYLQRWDALFDEGVASPRLLAFIDAA